MGVSNIFSDGVSMGVGDFFSSQSEATFIQSEYEREQWELENYP